MELPGPKIAYITAGAGGMYCGSCLNDNALAAALTRMGVDVQLIPTYTPIRTDEPNVSTQRVFLGGINVFLQQKSALFRRLPMGLIRWLDNPRLIRWVASRHVRTEAKLLGELTLSMLQGTSGHQRSEVQQLCQWLVNSLRPDLINLTNMLIAGFAPNLKQLLNIPLLVTLQGDDLFLDQFPEPYRAAALKEIERLVAHVDGFLVHSQYYADHMSAYLGIPPERIHQVRLGINTSDFQALAAARGAPAQGASRLEASHRIRPLTIGFMARLAPEKGLHILCDALIRLRQRPQTADTCLRVAGWLAEEHRAYVQSAFGKLAAAGCGDAYCYEGDVDRSGKLQLLRGIDVLCVPTTYREPKGLYVLEAMAAGVPVVQPDHGAFPEMLRATGGGKLVRPNDPGHLADGLFELLSNEPLRRELGQRAQRAVLRDYSAQAMADSVLRVYQRFLPGSPDRETGSLPT
jgi:glycosyltransferase involved in cell wall biosynthesis